jgi:hypothetical protein
MIRSLKSTWRSLRARRRLTVLDVIAEGDTATVGSASTAQ